MAAKAVAPDPNRIREHRKLLRLTLSDISERTGLSRAEISRLELGIRPLRAGHLIQFAKVFGCRPEDVTWPEEAQRLLGEVITRGFDRLKVRGRVVGHELVDMDKSFGEYEVALPNGLSRGGYVVYNPRTDIKAVKPGDVLVLTTIAPPRAGDLVVTVREKDNTGQVDFFDGRRARGQEVYKVAAILPQ